MSKKYKKSMHIFRRDLRLQDNTALLAALDESETVMAAFFFDPRQIEKHDYRSEPGLKYMIESLEYLDHCLGKHDSQLFCWPGVVEDELLDIIKKFDLEAIYINKDYTPFSKDRDSAIEKICSDSGIDFNAYHDLLLNEPGSVLKDDGDPYVVYTPFFKKASKEPAQEPRRNNFSNYFTKREGKLKLDKNIPEKSKKVFNSSGGRKEALKLLNKISTKSNYDDERNIPSIDGTTNLSVALKFGTISAREFYYKVLQEFDDSHSLIRELYWRDFFTHIAFHFPRVFSGCFYQKYDKLEWANDKKLFEAWTSGNTGFPIVDAGMRELNETGFMHNRVRMITASFLVKDLHIDWRWGEKYFATRLIDYDPAVNNGNWQWAASTGCDAQPYFRIFNPWRQQQRFDPDCEYIKSWIPELENYSAKEILKIEKGQFLEGYPDPIVDHKEMKEIAEDMFKDVK